MRSLSMQQLFAFFAMVKVSFGGTTTTTTDCDDTVDYICSDNRLSTLCSAIHISGISSSWIYDLSSYGEEKLTVFAPTNQAFDELEILLADPAYNHRLTDILLFHHAVDGEKARSINDLDCTGLLEMANGKDSRTVCTGHGDNDIKYHQKGNNNPRNDMPEIIDFDIPTCNGYIHVIDKVMLPETSLLPAAVATPPRPNNNMYDSINRRQETRHLRR